MNHVPIDVHLTASESEKLVLHSLLQVELLKLLESICYLT